MSGDELETLSAATREWLVRTRERPPRATVMPLTLPDLRGKRAASVLARLVPGSGLELGDPIGEGGMSVVRGGRQVALGREVAVKVLREGEADERAVLRMLREAWVTGALEHPNIVPVHDICVDARGQPQIVLKRIAGSVWADLMHDPRALRDRFGTEDALDWNVRTLMQVCNAVHFAHSRGVLHRDLKSENVMVGSFGEVYVLDWGLAVALEDDGSGRLPLAADVDSVAGTPAYMAPEMLDGDGKRLSVRTDVYLLGAILYEILVGRPPHLCGEMRHVAASILRSEPTLPAGTPEELVGIVRRALAREPDRRFASAEQLRQALTSFLEHRASFALAEDALAKLRELEAACRSPAVERTAGGGTNEERRLRLYDLFGECRFGFREALRRWSENGAARHGLARAVVLMVDVELEGGDPRAAELLLAELPAPQPVLAARVEAARKARADAERRRTQLELDRDPAIGRRTRLVISASLGIVWTLLPWAGWWMERSDPDANQLPPLVSSVATFVLAALVAHRARAALSRTALNRSLVRGVGVVLVAQIALFGATLHLGVSYEHTRVLVLMLYAACAALVAAAIESRLWPTAATYAAVTAIACVWPPLAWPVESVANLALTLNVLVIWRKLDPGPASGPAPGRPDQRAPDAPRQRL